MDYYDPFLSEWLTGASGQTLAQESETGAVALNNQLGQIYSANRAAIAVRATLFQTANFALTGSYNGTTVPENVALICAWTWMCSQNDIHANNEGHAELTLAFRVGHRPITVHVGAHSFFEWRRVERYCTPRCRRQRGRLRGQGPVRPHRRVTGPDGGRDSRADPLWLSARTEHHHRAQRVLHPAEHRLGLGREHRLQPRRPGHDRQPATDHVGADPFFE